MRRLIALAMLVLSLVSPAVRADDARVIKVLPQLLDKQGRHALSPSLYERDAYQFHLRKSPYLQGGMRLAVEWKPAKTDGTNVTMRAEMRGLIDDVTHTVTLQEPVVKNGMFRSWAEFKITGDDYKKFGHLVAWRVTLWNGDKQLSAMESYLWSGVSTNNPPQ